LKTKEMDENSLIEQIRALVRKLQQLRNSRSRWEVKMDDNSIHLDAGKKLNVCYDSYTDEDDPRVHVWWWEIGDDDHKNLNDFTDYM
jgi:hypothetical protein